MASITSVGIGSGLDVNSIVTQLVALEKKPLETLQTKATSIEAKVSEFAKIQAQFAALTDVATRISNVSSWSARSSTSSNSSAATITASATAVANAFSLDVDRLASKQSLSSATMTTGAKPGAGTLNIQLGTWNPDGTFKADSALPVSVTVENTDTLANIATKINDTKAGVSASVFNDGTNERLLVQSKNTGAAAGFRIQSADTSMAGLVFDKEATKQSLSSAAIPAGTPPGAGTLNIQMGTWKPDGTFTADGTAPAFSVTVKPTDTLTDIAYRIRKENKGVTASVTSDGTKERLLVESNNLGSAAGFSIHSPDLTLAGFEFDKEATKQSLSSAAITSDSKPGAGTLRIQLGTWNSDHSSFTSAVGTAAVNVTVKATDRLDDIAKAINDKNAGVTASVSPDQTQLVILSKNTGAASGFRIQSADTTMADFVFDPAGTKQTLSSSLIPLGKTYEAGTLNIQLGKWSTDHKFTPGGTPINVTITASNTLDDIKNAINDANAGVTASVSSDGTNNRLLIQSNDIGAEAGFRIQSADPSMADFVFDPENSPDKGMTASEYGYDAATVKAVVTQDGQNAATGMGASDKPVQHGQDAAKGMGTSDSPVQYGNDAAARINGQVVTSATNTLANNFSGVTIELLATTTTNYGLVTETKSPISMVVSEDVKPAVKNISDLVDAFNALNKMLKDLTKYDATTKAAALFQGDSMVVGMQNVLRSLVGSTSKGATSQRLVDIGLERQLDGSLSINTSKLATAANNGTTLQELFTKDNGNALTNGFALKFATLGKGVAATGGLVANKAASLQSSLDKNAKEQTKLNDRVTLFEARLRKQYTALDVQMSKLTALNSYVAQQVTLWNKSGG